MLSTLVAKTWSRNIIQGLLRSNNIRREFVNIPCDIINTLETDIDQAANFLNQLENGEVPTLIAKLPDEVIGLFKDTVGIFLTLPSQLVSAAEAGVTDAAKLFNDIGSGAIVQDLENVSGLVVSEITKDWSGLTSFIADDWNTLTSAVVCLFQDCPVHTNAVGSCGGSTSATQTSSISSLPSTTDPGNTTSAAPVSYQSTPTQTEAPSSSGGTSSTSPSNANPSTSSSQASYSSKSIRFLAGPSTFQICGLVALGLVGIALAL